MPRWRRGLTLRAELDSARSARLRTHWAFHCESSLRLARVDFHPVDCCHHRASNSSRDWRRKCIADLSITRRLLADELPLVWETLDPSGHTHGQPRHAINGKVRPWGSISESATVDVKQPPSLARSCRPKIRSAMQLRSANQSRGNRIRSASPGERAPPPTGRHQIAQRLPDRDSGLLWMRPHEVLGVLRFQSNQDESRPQLRNTKVGRVEYLPLWNVSKALEAQRQLRPIALKLRGRQPRNILKHHGARLAFLDQPQSRRKQVTVIVASELSARNRKWRTRDASGEEIDPSKLLSVQLAQVRVQDVPVWSICGERTGGVNIDLNSRRVLETGLL